MTSHEVIGSLLDGNARFRAGGSVARTYDASALAEIARSQKPIACVLACSDSRVAPEIVFDQPLGTIFACRVPGNVASESARWVAEMAVAEFKVPLVLVMGHTGCLAVDRVLNGNAETMAATLKREIQVAIDHAREHGAEHLFERAVAQNALHAARGLVASCPSVSAAVKEGWCRCAAGLYRMESGEFSLLYEYLDE